MASAINFFQAQDDARGVMKKMLLKLIILIPLVFAFISASLCLSLVFFSPSFAFISPLAILLLMVGGYLAQLLSSYDDGRGVAASLGGHEVSPNTTDINERRYLNVVQEMALASAMPVPLCYVIADDDNINAFAAGNTVSDAVICITRGSLLCLTRDELQAVVAREFSHLGNGDMRLPMRINCVLSAFAAPVLLAGMLLLLAALLISVGGICFYRITW
jgi:Zn-dependent protease with chaperone function